MTKKDLAGRLKIARQDAEAFSGALEALEGEGDIIKTRKNRYGIPERMDLVPGRLQCNPKGFAFVLPRNRHYKDVYIPADGLKGAMHNDRVMAKIVKGKINGAKTEGEIIRILERANNQVVGVFEKSKRFGFVIPDDARILDDIFIDREHSQNAKEGDKVVVEIKRWPGRRRNPEGVIIEILGRKGDIGVDVLSVIRSYGIREKFSAAVLKEAEGLPAKVEEDGLRNRVDLRDTKVVTIDGADAKDLDDAISVERLDGASYRLGVHIADVTHYITEGSKLDKEAYTRGTSVYFLDRVIPMLPEKLSNGICSLNPGVDRLTLSVFMEIDHEGNVRAHDICKSVIRSSERMTYTDLSDILEKDDADLAKRYQYLMDDFRAMEELYCILNSRRVKRGSIDFEFDETKVLMDNKGKPKDIIKIERRTADRIIEEFMLLCNETVAEHIYWLKTPCMYRVHEEPDQEKLEDFNKFIYNFGYSLKGIKKVHPKILQELVAEVKGKKEERVINTLMLRSLKRARYSHESLGHYGLALDYYCHFTAPIRRYPDLTVHRILKEAMKGRIKKDRDVYLREFVERAALQCSDRERAADEAERDVEDMKKIEYMSDRIGDEFEGIVSGVTAFGLFVELDNGIEGMVRVSYMEDDFYHFNEKNYMLIGERTRKSYRIGDAVKVQVLRANPDEKKLDLTLIDR